MLKPEPPAPLTLQQHLAQGYNCYVHGKLKPWSRGLFAEQLKALPDLRAEAERKLRELESMIRVRGAQACSVSTMQQRILADGLRNAAALPDPDAPS